MQSEDFKWFMEHMPELYKEYGPCFLVIKDKAVIGNYNSYVEAVNEAKKDNPLGSFIVQQCGSDESAYTNYISSFDFCA